MNRKQWLRMCVLMAVTLALFQLPRVVFAHHDDEAGNETPGATLIFDLAGCQKK